MSRARGLKQLTPLLGGLVTEANPLEFPEGATNDEINFSYDTNRSKRTRRRGLEEDGRSTVSIATGYEITSILYWKSAGFYLVAAYKDDESEAYVHVVSETFDTKGTFTIPVESSSILGARMSIGEISDTIAVMSSPASQGYVFVFEVVSDEDLVLYYSPLYYRDLELLPVAGATSTDRLSGTGEAATPTISREDPAPGVGGSVELTITFDRQVIEFDIGSLTPDNGTISNVVEDEDEPNKVFTVTFTRDASTLAATLTVDEDSYTDLYGANGNGVLYAIGLDVNTVIPTSSTPEEIGTDSNYAYNIGNAGWAQEKIISPSDLLSDEWVLWEYVIDQTGRWPSMSEYPVNSFQTDPDNGKEYFDIDLYTAWSPKESYAARGRFVKTLNDAVRADIDNIETGLTAQPLEAISSIDIT